MERIKILGIEVDNVTLKEAIEYSRKRISSGWTTKVYTPNSEMLVETVRDRSFEELLMAGDLLLPDGVGLLKGARFYKKRFKEKVAGVDYAHALLKMAKEEGLKVFLLGGKEEVVELAAQNVERDHPGILAGFHDGYFGPEGENEVIRKIKNSGADILLVALGMKKQERFIGDHLEQCGAKLGVGVGGTVDILAGTVVRAPEFFIRNGLEWLYRLIKQPSRFIRMLDLPRFIFLCFVDSLNSGE